MLVITVIQCYFQIGLVDRSSGKLFWYNLRDEQSFWMTQEDQERYQAEMSLDFDKRTTLRLAPTGPASPKKAKTPRGRRAAKSGSAKTK